MYRIPSVIEVLSKTITNINTARGTIITSAILPTLSSLIAALTKPMIGLTEQLLNVVYTRDDVMGRGDFWGETKGLVFVCYFSTRK